MIEGSVSSQPSLPLEGEVVCLPQGEHFELTLALAAFEAEALVCLGGERLGIALGELDQQPVARLFGRSERVKERRAEIEVVERTRDRLYNLFLAELLANDARDSLDLLHEAERRCPLKWPVTGTSAWSSPRTKGARS